MPLALTAELIEVRYQVPIGFESSDTASRIREVFDGLVVCSRVTTPQRSSNGS